ncbi:hypothetical protein BQ8482_60062 [Mesorhizobium delmotii]|uniref:Uncharacterized protein n=1 Tax=Mesorhizobium delmotii TaxID=1631247 RepID=A0A2P9AV31_9HYPH|nr:hypothetical protein BQ8482_60062 [Mesorhizobium delmotii]
MDDERQRRIHCRRGQPHVEVTGDQDQRMDDRFALDPRSIGNLAIGADHRRRRGQHGGDRHQEPHDDERSGLRADASVERRGCKTKGEEALEKIRQRQLRQISEHHVAGCIDARNPAFGAANRHRAEKQPGQEDACAQSDVHRQSGIARDARHGAADTIEMAEIMVLADHGNRMGRIAALIKPYDLTYMLIRSDRPPRITIRKRTWTISKQHGYWSPAVARQG